MSTPSNYTSPRGALATNRYDFQNHVDGYAFRHNSDQVDVNPPVVIQNTTVTTVADALTAISNYIVQDQSGGQGFITVGDGYDTWHNANGSINFDNTVPPLNDILKPVFDAIINNTTIPAGFERIQRGGIILIKAGTYIITETVDVPPGIILIGEGYGTKIVNAVSLDLSSLPPSPKLSPTIMPMFKIKADANRSVNDGAVDSNGDYFMFSKFTGFFNLVISDNFVENTILGDTYYKLPQNTDGYALIEPENGSNTVLDNVVFIGRMNVTGLRAVTSGTCSAVRLDVVNPPSNGSFLRINNCFIDGFSVPISFLSESGNKDFLEVLNSKIRAYGYLNGDTSSGANNCFFLTNDSNTSVKNNYLYGNTKTMLAGIYLNATVVSPPDAQGRSKITISNNDFEIDKQDNTANLTFNILYNGTGGSIVTYLVPTDINNTLQGYIGTNLQAGAESQFIVNGIAGGSFGGPKLSVSSEAVLTADIYITAREVPGDYVIPSSPGTPNFVILVNSPTAPVNITLPAVGVGRLITIKDIGGAAATYNITVLRNGGTIDGLASDYVINTNKGVLRLVTGNGSGGWWII